MNQMLPPLCFSALLALSFSGFAEKQVLPPNYLSFCPGSSCTALWGGGSLNENDFSYNNQSHTGEVICTPQHDGIVWSKTSKGNMMLSVGLKNNHNQVPLGCFTQTKESIQMLAAGKGKLLPLHGYIAANIQVSPGVSSNNLFPAFWLYDWKDDNWPNSGEIDIAEYLSGNTHTNLIGRIGSTRGTKWKYQIQNAKYANTHHNGLVPSNSVHQYGLEWRYNADRTSLTLTTYYDGVEVGKQYKDDPHNHGFGQRTVSLNPKDPYYDATTERNVLNGFPNMQIIFDASHAGPVSNYALNISKVSIYKVSNDPGKTCPTPPNFKGTYQSFKDGGAPTVALSWDKPDGSNKVTGYIISGYDGTPLANGHVGSVVQTLTDKVGQSPLGYYTYSIQSQCATGSSAMSTPIKVEECPAPNLAFNGVYSDGRVQLSWAKPTNPEIKAYIIDDFKGEPLSNQPSPLSDKSLSNTVGYQHVDHYSYFMQYKCANGLVSKKSKMLNVKNTWGHK